MDLKCAAYGSSTSALFLVLPNHKGSLQSYFKGQGKTNTVLLHDFKFFIINRGDFLFGFGFLFFLIHNVLLKTSLVLDKLSFPGNSFLLLNDCQIS